MTFADITGQRRPADEGEDEAQAPRKPAYSFLRRQNKKHGSDMRKKRLTEALQSDVEGYLDEQAKPSPSPEKRKTVEKPPLAPLVGKRVRIKDVNSMAELNGQTGVATGTAKGGRYRVLLDVAHSGGRYITLPPSNLELEAPLVGRRVRVVGLKGKAELNGRAGLADGYNAGKGRYHVRLDDTPGPAVMLKPTNVVAEGAEQQRQQDRPGLTRKRSGTLKIDGLDAVRRAAAEHDKANANPEAGEEADQLAPLQSDAIAEALASEQQAARASVAARLKKKKRGHQHKHKGKSLRRSHTKRKMSTRNGAAPPGSRRRKGSQRRKSHRHHHKPVSEMTEEEKEQARQRRREKRRKQLKHKVKKAAKTAALVSIALSNRARFEASLADGEGGGSRRRQRRSSVGDLAGSLRRAGLGGGGPGGGGGGEDASASSPGSRPRLRRNSSASKLQMLRMSATKGPAAEELTRAAKELEDLQRERTQKRLKQQQKQKRKKKVGPQII